MKKILFIDRDGTLIVEPTDNFQIDALAKLDFISGVFTWLGKIATQLDYTLVMVTNQDGLGTSSFPEEDFWPAHNKMISALANERIQFAEIHIDDRLTTKAKRASNQIRRSLFLGWLPIWQQRLRPANRQCEMALTVSRLG